MGCLTTSSKGTKANWCCTVLWVFWANMHCAPCDAWAGQQKSPLKYLLAPWERERKKSLLCIEIALCVRIKKRNIFCSPLIFVFQWYLGIFFSVFSFISLQKSLIGNWKYPRVSGVGCSCTLTVSVKTLSTLSYSFLFNTSHVILGDMLDFFQKHVWITRHVIQITQRPGWNTKHSNPL